MDIGSVLGGGGLVTVILAAGGGIKWWVGRQDARKDPIPKDQAAVALASSGVSLMQAVADELKAQMADLRHELTDLRSEQVSMRAHLGAAVRHIEQLLRAWPKSGPSRPPLPEDLRDLIDPALHD